MNRAAHRPRRRNSFVLLFCAGRPNHTYTLTHIRKIYVPMRGAAVSNGSRASFFVENRTKLDISLALPLPKPFNLSFEFARALLCVLAGTHSTDIYIRK